MHCSQVGQETFRPARQVNFTACLKCQMLHCSTQSMPPVVTCIHSSPSLIAPLSVCLLLLSIYTQAGVSHSMHSTAGEILRQLLRGKCELGAHSATADN